MTFTLLCGSYIEGRMAAWVEGDEVTIRAFGIHWKMTVVEADRLGVDIGETIEGGDPSCSSFDVAYWDDEHIGITKGPDTLILERFDAE